MVTEQQVRDGSQHTPLGLADTAAGTVWAARARALLAVQVARAVEGDTATPNFERWLKTDEDTRALCPCCNANRRRLPNPTRITARFRASKVDRNSA